MVLKQITARSLTVFLTSSTDHVTGKTGATLTITASKDGGAFASISPTVTELANGWYKLALTTSHTDTLGDLALHITASGADPVDLLRHVVAYDFADAVRLGLTALPNAAAEASGGLFTRGSGAGQINQPANGMIDANVVRNAGSAITAASGVQEVKVQSIAADAITAASIATDAIGSAELAASATSEIASAVRTELGTELGRIDVATSTRLASSSYAAPLDAAGTRSAVGLSSANLDTQLAAIPSAATIAGAVRDVDLSGGLTGDSLGDMVRSTLAVAGNAASAVTDETFGTEAIKAAVDALPTATENADALLDLANGVETDITPRGALRLMLAALAGKLSGAASTTVTIRNVGDTKPRITATVDADGNRTAVTVDAA